MRISWCGENHPHIWSSEVLAVFGVRSKGDIGETQDENGKTGFSQFIQ